MTSPNELESHERGRVTPLSSAPHTSKDGTVPNVASPVQTPTTVPPTPSGSSPTPPPTSSPGPAKTQAQFPQKLGILFQPGRYKVLYGGRGGAKSWGVARALLIIALQPQMIWPRRKVGPRILCARETQKSIEESVHKLLSDQITDMGLDAYFTIQRTNITAQNGAEFIFAGIRQNVHNIQSYEGCDIVWVEEAQRVSKNSWNVLIPTIRKDGSEIWISFNPELEQDETYQRFVTHPPSNANVICMSWRDNPWFPPVLRQEMEDLRKRDPDACDHVYEGMCKRAVEGAIYKNELHAMESEKRICRVPWNSKYSVNTFWDLGFGDNTSIWFEQSIGTEFHLIDHVSGSLKGLAHYTKIMQEKQYTYGTHWLPHDGRAHELGTGRSIQEQLQDVFGKTRVKCAKKLSIEDGIAAVRAIFSRVWMDKDKCADGIQSLRHYRYDFDENLGTYKRTPLHDWSSHDSDGFRTMALAVKEQERPGKDLRDETEVDGVYSTSKAGSGAWMS